jgi:hypothetical protein
MMGCRSARVRRALSSIACPCRERRTVFAARIDREALVADAGLDWRISQATARGLCFDFCQISAGRKLNRAPNCDRLQPGDIVSLDSDGSMGGDFGDLCRMGIGGELDWELQDLLQFVDDVQHVARGPIRPGAIGRTIYDAADAHIAQSPLAPNISFVAHGMGIIGHEAPRLSTRGPLPIPPTTRTARSRSRPGSCIPPGGSSSSRIPWW